MHQTIQEYVDQIDGLLTRDNYSKCLYVCIEAMFDTINESVGENEHIAVLESGRLNGMVERVELLKKMYGDSYGDYLAFQLYLVEKIIQLLYETGNYDAALNFAPSFFDGRYELFTEEIKSLQAVIFIELEKLKEAREVIDLIETPEKSMLMLKLQQKSVEIAKRKKKQDIDLGLNKDGSIICTKPPPKRQRFPLLDFLRKRIVSMKGLIILFFIFFCSLAISQRHKVIVWMKKFFRF